MKTAAYPPDRNPAGQIMNMSAPPRSTVTINTCSTAAGKNEAAVSSRAGLEIKIKKQIKQQANKTQTQNKQQTKKQTKKI